MRTKDAKWFDDHVNYEWDCERCDRTSQQMYFTMCDVLDKLDEIEQEFIALQKETSNV